MALVVLTTLPGPGTLSACHKLLCCLALGLVTPWAESEAGSVGQGLSAEGSEHQGKACLVALCLEMSQSLLCSSQITNLAGC